MRKGSKNIWSLCVNEEKLEILTGWADGGIRKFELKNYICNKQNSESNTSATTLLQNQVELNLINPLEKDYTRDVIIINERIICCTNLGSLYAIETDGNSRGTNDQKLLLKSDLLSNYNVMAKVKMNGNDKQWCLTIGTLKGCS